MGDFDPSKYLTKVGKADYLEVKWRLVWLREKHPDAVITTDCLDHAPGKGASFKARIVIPGGGAADGHGNESVDDFRDYYEKAETKAIGRALAALGFGSQFCPDHDFGGTTEKVVDAPVTRPNAANGKPVAELVKPSAVPKNERAPSLYPPRSGSGPTDAQRNFMRGLAKQLGWTIVGPDGGEHHDEAQMNAEVGLLYPGKTIDGLTTAEASAVIEQWQKIQADRRARLGIK
jgi:hypothetical protein